MSRERDQDAALAKAIADVKEALRPKVEEITAAAESLTSFIPHDVPKQFTDQRVYPYGPKHFDEAEQAQDATCGFFSEAYLYTLLGKEDARTLRLRLRELLTAAGLTDTEARRLM